MRTGSTALLILCLFAAAGCGGPGSNFGRVGLAGSVDAPEGELPPSLSVILPASYGMGGLDEFFAAPQDYGHRTRTVLATVSDGKFTAEFDVMYHTFMWLLPPLGHIPRHPPPPYFVIRFAEAPDEFYVVGVVDDRIEYKVFDTDRRAEKHPQDSIWQIEGHKYERADNGDGNDWILHVGLTRVTR